jgi:quercetin dioxygenase-like cupin family protein
MTTRLISYTVVAAIVSGYFFAAAAGAQPVSPQSGPGGGVLRAVLASAALPSVVDAPRYFKVLRVSVPARQVTKYNGAVGFVFALSGSLEVTSGADRQLLGGGDGVLIAGGMNTTFKASGSEPAVFLHFVMLTADELGKSMEGRPAVVTELYQTASPIPGLKPGPYEFTLTRVTFPPRQPINPPHRRSGAAMYYILGGTGMFTTGGKTEPKPAGAIHYEPYDLVHQWANPGDASLVILQANISQEGVPAVIFVPDAGANAPR